MYDSCLANTLPRNNESRRLSYPVIALLPVWTALKLI